MRVMRTISRVRILIRGELYETKGSTLNRYPSTLLGSCERRESLRNPCTNAIEIDCSQIAFDAILFYYQSFGKLTRPPQIGMAEFVATCQLFEIDEEKIYDLCVREKYFFARKCDEVNEEKKPLNFREKMWEFLEEPNSSCLAKVYGSLSNILIVASTIVNLAVTEPAVKDFRVPSLVTDPWSQAEFTINTLFGIEYIIRLIASPSKYQFVTGFQNLIDLVAVFPYFVSLAFKDTAGFEFLKGIRTVRVLRALRFSKQSELISSVLDCLKNCVHEFLVLLLCLCVNCLLCGGIAYYIEVDVPGSSFQSVLDGMWWAMQTIVCLGYGDIVPTSFLGKIFAMSVALFGATTLSIPLLSLGSKYVSLTAGVFNVDNSKVERHPKLEFEVNDTKIERTPKLGTIDYGNL